MSDQDPKPGTVEYAQLMCDHFSSLSRTLKEVMGPDSGVQWAMLFGVRYEKEGQQGMEIRATGGVRNSIRVCANICNIAAMTIAKKNPDMTLEEATLKVLEDLKTDMLTYKPYDFKE